MQHIWRYGQEAYSRAETSVFLELDFGQAG